jgi:glyoxalase family protein
MMRDAHATSWERLATGGEAMSGVHGLHHVTAIAGPAQQNLDFYAGVLGLRLVKRSVNQDDPGTYHLFYADADGHPGSDLTFFPWSEIAPRRDGHGLSTEVSLTIPRGSIDYWGERLERGRAAPDPVETRFGDRVLPFSDPHGLRLALVERADAGARRFTAWERGPIPVAHQIRGLESARLRERELGPTAAFLEDVLGFTAMGVESGWRRFGVEGGGSGAYVDVAEDAAARRGAWGVGAVHHLAWRVTDESHQVDVRAAIERAGRRPTPVIDRFWFKSVYFLEPGGVLFELATDGPGFSVDEPAARLGESLVLPPWLEPQRRAIESMLPPIAYPPSVTS